MSFPSKPAFVTPEWLTAKLNASGIRGTIHDMGWQVIGAGQVGENARFHIAGEGDLPPTLVGKFPSTNALSRQLGVALNNYGREVYFYSQLSETVDIQVPRCFAAEFDPESHDFVLILEDLAPGVQIDQISECTMDQAALALQELAKLHGPRWGEAGLANIPLLAQMRMDTESASPYQTFLDAFRKRYGNHLSHDEMRVAEGFGEYQAAYANPDAPRTIIHIDYRLDNMIFGGPHPLTVFDWQSVNHGHALQDVSYFLGTSISTEQRRQHERELLGLYLDVLAGYGVRMSLDDCWRLYRHFAPAGLNMSVLVSTLVGETARGNDMFLAMARRSIAMCEDLETLSLLGATAG